MTLGVPSTHFSLLVPNVSPRLSVFVTCCCLQAEFCCLPYVCSNLEVYNTVFTYVCACFVVVHQPPDAVYLFLFTGGQPGRGRVVTKTQKKLGKRSHSSSSMSEFLSLADEKGQQEVEKSVSTLLLLV